MQNNGEGRDAREEEENEEEERGRLS